MERVERAPGALGRTAGLAVDAGAPAGVRPWSSRRLLLRLEQASVFFVHGAQKPSGPSAGPGSPARSAAFDAMGLKPALLIGHRPAAVLEFAGAFLLVLGCSPGRSPRCCAS
jgi:hypothetical protein